MRAAPRRVCVPPARSSRDRVGREAAAAAVAAAARRRPPARPRALSSLVASMMSSSGGDEIETPPSPSDVDAVRAYVTTGPLFPQLEMRDRDVTETRVAEWIALVAELCDVLGFDAHSMDDAQASRTYRYYLPVYLWTEARILAHVDAYQTPQRSRDPPPPLVVGLSAPQGCGKTTVVSTLVKLLERRGTRAASLSIDDVYLTGAEQDALAAANPTNALLRFRGNAGSHDVGLGVETLRALRDVNGVRGDGSEARGAVRVPRYDKTMRGGRGDRAPVDAWPEVQAPLDVVLLEARPRSTASTFVSLPRRTRAATRVAPPPPPRPPTPPHPPNDPPPRPRDGCSGSPRSAPTRAMRSTPTSSPWTRRCRTAGTTRFRRSSTRGSS